MKVSRNFLRAILCVLLLLLGVIALVQSAIVVSVRGQARISSYRERRVERIIGLSDGSFLVEIDGELFRAFSVEQVSTLQRQAGAIQALKLELSKCELNLKGEVYSE